MAGVYLIFDQSQISSVDSLFLYAFSLFEDILFCKSPSVVHKAQSICLYFPKQTDRQVPTQSFFNCVWKTSGTEL